MLQIHKNLPFHWKLEKPSVLIFYDILCHPTNPFKIFTAFIGLILKVHALKLFSNMQNRESTKGIFSQVLFAHYEAP